MKLRCFEYNLPFTRPFKTSGGSIGERNGLWIELKKGSVTALGEAAPLPGFSRESLEDVIKFTSMHREELTDFFSGDIGPAETDTFFNQISCPPSLEFAICTLVYDYCSRKQKTSIQRLLFGDPVKSVGVNAVISLSKQSDLLQSVQQAVKEGYKTVKFKVGRNFDSELRHLQQVRKSFPGLTIRLDANQRWKPEEAQSNLEAMKAVSPEYCEEPLSNPTPQSIRQLSKESPVAIALDESLAGGSDFSSYAWPGIVFILKPMVLGSFSKLFATKGLADTHNNKVVITTSLESGVGRLMTAILASGLGNPDTEHGLATGKNLKMDVWHDGTYINNGSFNLPDTPGLGKKNRPNLQNLAIREIEL